MHIKENAGAQGWFRRHAAAPSSTGAWKAFVARNKRAQEPQAMAEGGPLVGTPTEEVTQFDRRIYETPEGEEVSEKSTTLFFNGNWINIPSIHEGRSFTNDQLRLMIKEGKIEPTSVHGSRIEAEEAAASRSDMMKSHVKGFDDGGQVIGKPGGLVEPGVEYYGVTKLGKKYVASGQRRGKKFHKTKDTKREAQIALNAFYKKNPTYAETGELKPPIKNIQKSAYWKAYQKRSDNINKELTKLINKANAGEKYVSIKELKAQVEKNLNIKISKIESPTYPVLKNLDSTSTKIENVLKNMLIEDKPLNDNWMHALSKRAGLVKDTVYQGLRDSPTFKVIGDEGAKYLNTIHGIQEYDYLKNKSFSDQLRTALEIKEGRPTFTGLGGEKLRTQSPRAATMKHALRSWDQNQGEGAIKFFDKNGKVIKWKHGLKLPYKEVSFSHNGKRHNVQKLSDIDYLKKHFSELYEKQTALNKLSAKKVNNPFKKGTQISMKELVKKIQVDGYQWKPRMPTLEILHGAKGVKEEPFTNLTYASRDLNQLESGISASLKHGKITQEAADEALKIIRKDIQGLTGSHLDKAIIKRQFDLAKKLEAGTFQSYEDLNKSLRRKVEKALEKQKVPKGERGFIATAMLEDFGKMGLKGGRLLKMLELQYEPLFEGLMYQYAKKYKGYDHSLAREELFLPKMIAKLAPDLWEKAGFKPFKTGIMEGADPLIEKDLYEIRGTEKENLGKVIGEKKLVKNFIDNNKRMEEISSKYQSLEDEKRARELDSEQWGYNMTLAHPRLDTVVNEQRRLENEYKQLEKLNSPDSVSGFYNAYQIAKEKQDHKFGMGKIESKAESAKRKEKRIHDEYLEYRGGKDRSFYLPKGKLKERVEDPLFKTPYTFLETDMTVPDMIEPGREFWESYGLTDEEGTREKWKQIYDMGGIDLMDRIGIAGGVANMAEGGIMSLKNKW